MPGDYPGVLNTTLNTILVSIHPKDQVHLTILKYIQFLELMETSLFHTRPDTSKINPFNEIFFKRWQERIYSTIDVVNLGHILIDPKPKSDFEDGLNGKMGTNKFAMTFLTHSQMNTLMFIFKLKLQKIFGMQ